ncbi:TIGR00270 family protein [Candidatus Micrarchaeota archaeon]|nr:TIGR00270 family protein [Candidatus Micrarchaeota archaeon]
MECHVCGSDASREALVEGARVFLCPRCLHYGKPIERERKPVVTSRHRPERPARELNVVDGYGKKIQAARDKRGQTRQQLARELFIRENELERLEHEWMRPDVKLAQKLEKALQIQLIEDVSRKAKSDESEEQSATLKPRKRSKADLTLADIIDVKVNE